VASLELCDRAVRLISERGVVPEADLLAHVYGGSVPDALRLQFVQPLLADGRLRRDSTGHWSLQVSSTAADGRAFTALALAATGPTPGRARLVRLVARHVENGETVERFDATFDPRRRVPRYVAARAGLDAELLNGQPTFAQVLDDFVLFLADRPVVAQDARLTWAFLDAEARLAQRNLIEPPLVDVNELAAEQVQLMGKPTLGLVAAHLGINSADITRVDEEARVLGLVGARLLQPGTLRAVEHGPAVLRHPTTARALPEQPGVYVLRDAEQQPLYVGKARRLRSRVAAYVHRPLGPTRRLEGLVGSVNAVDTTLRQTDLEALILEDREIRRLQPRFNTVRRQRTPRYWIHLPAASQGKKLAPPRLGLSSGPDSDDGEFVGPFRNESLAEHARKLARDVFELDALRRARSTEYRSRLAAAWRFLHGDSAEAETLARRRGVMLLRKVLAFDVAAMQLPADPRRARYGVIRPMPPRGVEAFLLERAICIAWGVLEAQGDVPTFARALLETAQPRTRPEDADVVLRWFGAQRPPAQLVWLPDDDCLGASDAIEDAVYALIPEA
jgi:DNA polymerase III epsilon subunit-like protein